MAARRLTLLLLLVAATASLAREARATTIVPMSDEDLTVSTRAIVEGTVVRTEPVWDAQRGVVSTYTTFDVEKVYKGDVPPGLIVLKQLGGATATHVTVIYGTADLAAGQKAILFLNTDADGALHVAHMKLGCFRIAVDPASRQEIVLHPLSGSAPAPAAPNGGAMFRGGHAEFVGDVLDTLEMDATTVAAYREASAGTPIRIAPREYTPGLVRGGSQPAYTLLGDGFRWFEPDKGQVVAIKVDGDAAPTPSHGVDEAKAAFAAWSSVSGASLRLQYGGASKNGGIKTDGQSVIAFGDPLNQVDDLVNCSGIIALSGVVGSPSETVSISGKRFVRILEGDLVLNNGIECLNDGSGLFLREIVTHEVGHILGLGHPSEDRNEPNPLFKDATMYFIAHRDGRGASLRQDDSDGLRYLYPGTSSSLALQTDALPDAVPGVLYSYRLAAKGGTSPYAWSVSSGSLPSGLSLGADGQLLGLMSSETSAGFTISVRDQTGATQQRALTLRVSRTPAPFLEKASYNQARARLVITGVYLDAAAAISINGHLVAPPRTVKYKATKGQLSIGGSESELHLAASGANSIVVTAGDRQSNTLNF